ncbi:uncharacterized protein LOC111309554 [Durio zibethinus]|uniref:Uncharacterized protein LOC111309554 n=1 Tax=Durio zibethinus TaxID=66656 RepID=A0A6P6AHH4_DURZI|nr:uncharacterized protein LOC111309554 [Durio zibethinus]
MEEINWDSLFLELDSPDFRNILEDEPEPPQPSSTASPGEEPVVNSWVDEIEKALMEDDQFDDRVEIQPVSDDFLADILVDSPPSNSDETIDDAAFHKQDRTRITIDNDDPIAKKQRRESSSSSTLSKGVHLMHPRPRQESAVLLLVFISVVLQNPLCWVPCFVPGHHVRSSPCQTVPTVSSGGSATGEQGKKEVRKEEGQGVG